MGLNSISNTIMKSLFRKPATAMYPVVKNEFYCNTRGKIEIAIDDCIYCGLCSRRCPAGAIEVSKPDLKWQIDRSRCVICNFCTEVCPKKCLTMNKQYTSPTSDPESRLTVALGKAKTAEAAPADTAPDNA